MKHVSLALGFCLALVLMSGCVTEEQKHLTPTKSGERVTTMGKALDAADRSACGTYVGQLNQAAMIYQQNNELYPPDLATVIKESQLGDAVKDCKFTYDPATGRVSLVR